MVVRITLLLIYLILAGQLSAQVPDSLPFPAGWSGDWAGNLEIFNGKGLVQVLSILEKTGPDTLVFEIVTGKETPISTTGNTKQGEEDIPEVKTYPIGVYQRAVLHKK